MLVLYRRREIAAYLATISSHRVDETERVQEAGTPGSFECKLLANHTATTVQQANRTCSGQAHRAAYTQPKYTDAAPYTQQGGRQPLYIAEHSRLDAHISAQRLQFFDRRTPHDTTKNKEPHTTQLLQLNHTKRSMHNIPAVYITSETRYHIVTKMKSKHTQKQKHPHTAATLYFLVPKKKTLHSSPVLSCNPLKPYLPRRGVSPRYQAHQIPARPRPRKRMRNG